MSTRTAATGSATTTDPPASEVIPLHAAPDQPHHSVGGRAWRLGRAQRAGLPVPAGVVITASAFALRSQAERETTITDQLVDVLDSLGHQGQTPLRVSLSAKSAGSPADTVEAARPIAGLSELLHAVRRFSATATILGDGVAVVIQHDVLPVRTGTLSTRSADHRSDRRLDHLARQVNDVFGGDRPVTWAVDRADQLWILDIGAARLPIAA